MNVREIKKRLSKLGPKNQGIEIKRMAKAMKISPSTVRRYTNIHNSTPPSLAFMDAVSDAYGVSLDHLVKSAKRTGNEAVDTKWQFFLSYWSANLSTEQKNMLMAIMETVWTEAVEQSARNPSLLPEQADSRFYKL